jgi:hypothetical protein
MKHCGWVKGETAMRGIAVRRFWRAVARRHLILTQNEH